ncbi:MAG: WXG100 family type VII secretion target [Clostridiaceae bacterium]|nr:WXG100 family type VII secretion target [Clostridiaceae bacterium]
MAENIIAIDQSQFDSAISNLDTIYKDMVSNQSIMRAVTNDLFDGWNGNGAKAAKTMMEKIDKNLNTNIENFLSLKNTLSSTKEDFNSCDYDLKNQISQKMNKDLVK